LFQQGFNEFKLFQHGSQSIDKVLLTDN